MSLSVRSVPSFLLCFVLTWSHTVLINALIHLDCWTLSFSFNWLLFKTLTSQAWSAMQWTGTVCPHLNICDCFVCLGMAQSLGMGSGQTSGLHHTSMKYSDQPQGPDTFTDFVTLVCQEAQSSQNQVHTLCLAHTPGVLSHTHPVSCLTVTHACNTHTHTLCHVLQSHTLCHV